MQAYAQAGNYQEAVTLYHEAEQMCGKNPLLRATLGYVYAFTGEAERARDVLSELNELARHQYVSPTYAAFVYTALIETTSALEMLEKAYAENDPHLEFLKVYPQFDALLAEPRFQMLMQKMNVAGRT